jgi:2,3-bisphosphoglycerate-dependent phosphoglycerate mutase
VKSGATRVLSISCRGAGHDPEVELCAPARPGRVIIVSMDKSVWFVRHGESEANAGMVSESPKSIQLTWTGAEQAEEVAKCFTTDPELIVVSPYQRGSQTAMPLINKVSIVPVEIWPVQEFTYLAASRCVNTTYEQRKPMVRDYWERADAAYNDGPDTESFADFMTRVRETLDKLEARKEKFIAVFSHGQFIRALMWMIITGRRQITENSMAEFHEFMAAVSMNNAAILKLEFKGSETYLSGIITSHLSPDLLTV